MRKQRNLRSTMNFISYFSLDKSWIGHVYGEQFCLCISIGKQHYIFELQPHVYELTVPLYCTHMPNWISLILLSSVALSYNLTILLSMKQFSILACTQYLTYRCDYVTSCTAYNELHDWIEPINIYAGDSTATKCIHCFSSMKKKTL